MKFLSLLPALLLPSLLIASPVDLARRDDLSDAIVQGITNIGTQIHTVNASVNGFPPGQLLGVFKALKVQRQTKALIDQVDSVSDSAKASTEFSNSGALKIAGAAAKLSPDIKSLLDNIVAHKSSFTSGALLVGDLSKTVQGDLRMAQSASRQLFAAVTAKLPSNLQSAAGLITQPIDDAFTAAIRKFATCSGVLCLPDLSDDI